MYRRLSVFAVVVLFSLLPVMAFDRPVSSHGFISASWTYPDAYGQGVDEIRLYQLLGGSWDALTPFGYLSTNAVDRFEINETGNMQVNLKSWFNNTHIGAIDFNDGKNYLRFIGSLYTDTGALITQQNGTYYGGTDASDPMFYYFYNVTFPFTPTSPSSYTAYIDYQILEDAFEKRREIDITGASGAGTGYQVLVNVTYDSDMQVDFGDIRFTDDDGITELDYWMQEKQNSTYAVFWVEVQDNLDTAQSIYMYYDSVIERSTTSDGYAVFEFFEDWEEGAVNGTRWDTDYSGGSSSFSTTDANHGYVHKIEGGTSNGIQSYSSVANTSSETAVLFRAYLEETLASYQQTRLGMSNKIVLESNYGVNKITYFEDYLADYDQTVLSSDYFDAWYTFEFQRDSDYGTDLGLFYANTTLVDYGGMTPDTTEDNWFYLWCRDTEYDLYSDWIAGRKFVTGDPAQTTSIGSEESLSSNWADISSLVLVFAVPISETALWGLNVFYIIAGLVMIPASTLYLVKGGRKEMNSTKLLYGLIILFLGLGLFIGGVVP